MRQLIIARKDLQMSPGKLAAQVRHASMAFLTNMIKQGRKVEDEITINMPSDIYDEWICGIFTKTICEARNKNHLMKAVSMAEEMGLKENTDFFLIRDNCLTELVPEDEDGRTLTCIGFRPLPDDTAHAISRKYQLYK